MRLNSVSDKCGHLDLYDLGWLQFVGSGFSNTEQWISPSLMAWAFFRLTGFMELKLWKKVDPIENLQDELYNTLYCSNILETMPR